MKQFSLLHQLAVKELSDPLHQITTFTLSQPQLVSWFNKLNNTAQLYTIMDRLALLLSPPKKAIYIKHVKTRIISYLHSKLSKQAERLPSLMFLKSSYLKLGHGPTLYGLYVAVPQKL